jgi:hypothetical protein
VRIPERSEMPKRSRRRVTSPEPFAASSTASSLEIILHPSPACGGRSQRAVRAGRGVRDREKRGRPPRGKGTSPLHNMIRDVIKKSARPMKLGDIAEKVKAAGPETTSPNYVKLVDRGTYATR